MVMVEVGQAVAPKIYQDEAVTMAEFILKPDVPQKYKDKFIWAWSFISHLSATANLSDWDITRLMMRMSRVSQLFSMGNYDYGYELCARTMAELQFSRGRHGFWTIQSATTRSVQRVEESLAKTKKDSWGQRIKKSFGRKEPPATEGEASV